MRLAYLYTPVRDLDEALRFYRDLLGCKEVWRDGATTCALKLPGGAVEVLLDVCPPGTPAGPMYIVSDVRAFFEQNRSSMTFVEEPRAISPGWLASFEDPSGNLVRVMDRTAPERAPRT